VIWELSTDMLLLEAFIALKYTRGIHRKAHLLVFLWNKTYELKIF